jgi:hypothetical protein
LQKLQVQHDSIDGIFHLVGHAAGHPAAAERRRGHFNFVADAADGFGIAHDEEAPIWVFFS